MQYRPLADEIRPQTLEDVVGQSHILGKNGVLRRIIESGQVPNMVFWPVRHRQDHGANIIANQTHRHPAPAQRYHRLHRGHPGGHRRCGHAPCAQRGAALPG